MTATEVRSLPAVVDVVTAAEVLGIGRTVAYELVRTNRFPTPVLRVGRQIKGTHRVPARASRPVHRSRCRTAATRLAGIGKDVRLHSSWEDGPMSREPIRKITLSDGSMRYRVVVDAGRKPDGSRAQRTSTHRTRREAREWLAAVRSDLTRGTYVARCGPR